MHKSITSAMRKTPTQIVNDVTMTGDEDMGSPVVKITRRGQTFSDYTTVAELEKSGGQDFVGEGHTYNNLYFCDGTVPSGLVDLLSQTSAIDESTRHYGAKPTPQHPDLIERLENGHLNISGDAADIRKLIALQQEAADELKRVRKIEDAAVIVMAGINGRIADAVARSKPAPVFHGIAQLHDALFGRPGNSEGE